MAEATSFVGFEVPDSFECRIRGRILLPQATVELHEYRFRQPQRHVFESRRAFLDLALSRRPGHPRGRYLAAPGLGTRDFGDILFVPARHGLSSEWGPGAQRSVCCEFEPEEGDGWSDDQLDASLDVRSPFLRDGLARLAREIEQPGFGSPLMAEALCLQIKVELGRYFRRLRPSGGCPAGGLSAAQLRRIEERLALPGRLPSVGELALELGLSSRHFFRLFRAATGTTLTEFAAERRICQAKALLGTRGAAIKQVAWQCGFETPAAFSAAFRRATGFSPREYRRLSA